MFIGLNYWDNLGKSEKIQLMNSLQYKGIDYFDYMSSTQRDDLIDSNEIGNGLLQLMDRLGILR